MPSPKTRRFEGWEIAYLRANQYELSIRQMADHLKRTPNSIRIRLDDLDRARVSKMVAPIKRTIARVCIGCDSRFSGRGGGAYCSQCCTPGPARVCVGA
jgi:hypothetical protein